MPMKPHQNHNLDCKRFLPQLRITTDHSLIEVDQEKDLQPKLKLLYNNRSTDEIQVSIWTSMKICLWLIRLLLRELSCLHIKAIINRFEI